MPIIEISKKYIVHKDISFIIFIGKYQVNHNSTGKKRCATKPISVSIFIFPRTQCRKLKHYNSWVDRGFLFSQFGRYDYINHVGSKIDKNWKRCGVEDCFSQYYKLVK